MIDGHLRRLYLFLHVSSRTPEGTNPMPKLSDLRDAALSDQALVKSDQDVLSKATSALAASQASAAVSTPAFGKAIAAKGGTVLDATVSPAVLYTAPADGSTFAVSVPPLITDDAPVASPAPQG